MIITTNDILFYIATAIRTKKFEVIQGMNNAGYPVPNNISNADLLAAVWEVFQEFGIGALQNVFSKVAIDSAKLTSAEAQALFVKFRGGDPNARLIDTLQGIGNYFGDLLGGSSVAGGTVTNVSSQSALSPTTITLIVIIGIIMITLFRKFIGVVVAIVIMVLALVLYGIFAKKITTTVTGGDTTTHGGIGSVILAFLTGKG